VCGSIFHGKKADFLAMEVAPRSDPLVTSSTSLKRKRDDEDDADLYGDSETTDKKPRGEQETLRNGNPIEFAVKGEEKPEELEWLIFLVGQEGQLEVCHIASFINCRYVG